jgi:ATP-dependent exoDNAse (exonuclease V) beta subunit
VSRDARIVETEKPAVDGALRGVSKSKDGTLRPGGKRFGASTRFSRERLEATPAEVAAYRKPDDPAIPRRERKAAASAVARACHPLLERARAAAHQLETPLVYREPTGRLVEGVPDLVFRDEDSDWTLVDFKTDLRLDIAEDAHRSQVALYKLALEEATATRAEGWLLYI